ncbi:MAG: chromate transporter, partial [Thermoanaerobaculia bacterium]
WWAPLFLIALWLGRGHVLVTEGVFFSKMALVTFGGAYAVLAYVAQQAVEVLRWLRPGEMLDGLGMAETTPGPLIMVLEFVGFLAGYRNPGSLSPLAAGVLGAAITTWVTFVPCFLWIFLGAPYIESLRGVRWLTAALSGVTAAVVGVILNLAVWFSLHTLFGRVGEVHAGRARLLVPDWSTLDPAVLLLTVAAMLALFRFKLGMIPTLLGSAVIGAAVALLR